MKYIQLELNLNSNTIYEQEYRGYIIHLQESEKPRIIVDGYEPPKRNRQNLQFWSEVTKTTTWSTWIYKKGNVHKKSNVTSNDATSYQQALQMTKTFIDILER